MADKKTAALGALLLLIGGCNAPAGSKAKLPAGETDLSCAALIFAKTNLLKDQGVSGGGLAGAGDYIAAMTKYASAYAASRGIGADEALGEVKVEAYRMTGKAPGAVILSTESIVRRAKACTPS
jgi:hypothetical protein